MDRSTIVLILRIERLTSALLGLGFDRVRLDPASVDVVSDAFESDRIRLAGIITI